MRLGLLVPLPAGVVTLSLMVCLLLFSGLHFGVLTGSDQKTDSDGTAHGSTEVPRLLKGNGTRGFTRIATAQSVTQKGRE